MTAPVVIMTGTDISVFKSGAPSDTLERFRGYAARLERAHPGSQLVYCALRAPAFTQEMRNGNLLIVPVPGGPFGCLVRFLRILGSLHRRAPISVIATQTAYEDALATALFARWRGVPLVVQVHNDPLASQALRRLLLPITLRCAQLVRVVNPALARLLQQRYPRADIRCLPVPVTMTAGARTDIPSPPVVLIVSRLSPEKGVDIALDVMARVITKVPDIRMRILGDGIERMALEQQARLLGIEASIRFEGMVPYQTLPEAYAQATLLLLTSRHESFGRVIVEAMRHGVPVVATRTAGAMALLEGSSAGFLHEHADIDGLARSVVALAEDRELCQQMGDAARQAGAAYDPDMAAARWVDALLDAASATRTPDT